MPASVATECRCAADLFIDRDAERLAEACNLTARTINRQRERHDDRALALEIVTKLLYAARALGWSFDRRLTYLRPALDALGASAVEASVSGTAEGLSSALSGSLRESSEAHAAVVDAMRGGVTASELPTIERQIQEAIESLHKLRAEAREGAGNVREIRSAS